MPNLPEGWVADYDGSRWLWRYKSTGIVQYQFPQEGDEFPEWYDDGADDLPLEPEAWLASDQQVRRRSTLVSDSQNPSEPSSAAKTTAATSRRKRSETIPEDEEMSATGYFDPSSFMYFGPGGDISPVGGDDDGGGAASTARKSETPTPSPGPTPSTVHSQVSPAPGPPALPDPHASAVELPEDNAQLWKPTGFVAELPTHDTVRCAEELAPVEMDGTSYAPAPIHTDPVQGGPVELPTHRSSVERAQEDSKPVTHSSPATPPPVKPVTEYPLVSASFAYPPMKTSTPGSTDSSRHQSPQMSTVALQSAPAPVLQPRGAEAEPAKFQPWSPPKNVTQETSPRGKRASMVLSGPSILQLQNNELGQLRDFPGIANSNDHRLSVDSASLGSTSDFIPGTRQPVSPIPQALQPAHLNKRVSLPDIPDLSRMTNQQPQANALPGSSARHQSISSGTAPLGTTTNCDNSSIHPSILMPAGRDLLQSRPTQSQAAGNGSQNTAVPPMRSANAFPAYVTAQRALQGSPVAVQQASSQRPQPPPGPRRLQTEPNFHTSNGLLQHGTNRAPATTGHYQRHAPQELSSDNTRMPIREPASQANTQTIGHMQAPSPVPVIHEMSATKYTDEGKDDAMSAVRPLSLARSKSPSPETRTAEAVGTTRDSPRADALDLISEVMSVMDQSIGSSRRTSVEPVSLSPANSAAAPSQTSLAGSGDQRVSISSQNSTQLAQRQGSLSVPSRLNLTLVSPLSSPCPSRQQSLSGDAHQPTIRPMAQSETSLSVNDIESPGSKASPGTVSEARPLEMKTERQESPHPILAAPAERISNSSNTLHQEAVHSTEETPGTAPSLGVVGGVLDPISSQPQLQDLQGRNISNMTQSSASAPLMTNERTESQGPPLNAGPSPTQTPPTAVQVDGSMAPLQPQDGNFRDHSGVSLQGNTTRQSGLSQPRAEAVAHGHVNSSVSQQVPNARQQPIQHQPQPPQQPPQQQMQQPPLQQYQQQQYSAPSQTWQQGSLQGSQSVANMTQAGAQSFARPVAGVQVSHTNQNTAIPTSASVPTLVSPSPPPVSHGAGTSPASVPPPGLVVANQSDENQSQHEGLQVQQGHHDGAAPRLSEQEAVQPANEFVQKGEQSSTEPLQGQVAQSTSSIPQNIPANGAALLTQENTSVADVTKPEPSAQDELEAPKPFPMLPGQVTPLPSQIGSAPVPMPIPVVSEVQQGEPGNNQPGQASIVSKQAAQATAPVPLNAMPVNGGLQPLVGQQPGASQYGQGQGQITQAGFVVPQYQPAYQPQAGAGANQAQTNSSITDAGKSMKKWAKKMFSSGSDKSAAPAAAAPTRPVSVIAQPQQMQRPSQPQQMFQPQGPMQGQVPPGPVYTLPVRPQPPLMSVPENQPLGIGHNRVSSQFNGPVMGQSAKPAQPLPLQNQMPIPQQTQPKRPQLNTAGPNTPNMGLPAHHGNTQRPLQTMGQPQMTSPGLFQPQAPQQQQKGHQGPSVGYNQGHMPMRPGGYATTAATVQGQSQPTGGPIPANSARRRNSATYSGQPIGQQANAQSSTPPRGQIPVSVSQGQLPTQQPVMQQMQPQQQQQQVQKPGQQQIHAQQQQVRQTTQQPIHQPAQQHMQQPGRQQMQKPMPQPATQQPGGWPAQTAVPAGAQPPASLPKHGQYPMQEQQLPQGRIPQQSQGQTYAPQQGTIRNSMPPGPAGPSNVQPPVVDPNHKKTWSKENNDYSGGDWGDNW